ncbi:TonB-dependent receptor [Parasulfuritortus cantonensis]|uniref:TonB-dependent receptor n=1 Tax=Parasulfuritortus cantonensis TaxID=2528202 RepID=A0A4R1B8M4_9PROT|nr:TonB-dependent receptor [Parasulfuritortus cantonensis]TCJ13458.1 TonB-dependent receptor [Parasulfuritortus cantonensis]
MNTRLLAIACAMACHLPARAETPYALDEIVVTASRFEQERVIQPAQVRVIGPDEIAASNALTVPDLLERAAGLSVRSLYGDTPSAVELDARGYGETGSSHVLVLLDGRRLNAPDSNAVDMWSTIPLSRVERIEVQYGGGTVLYGDNAVGAVVNIVTRDDRSATTSSGRAGLTAGSFGTLQGNGALTLAGPALTGRLDVAATRSDGYRDHERSHGASAGGRIATRPGDLSAFVDFGLGRLDADLPGYLTLDQARADPRASVAGNGQGDSQRDTWHLRPGLVYKPAEGVTVQAELGYDANHLDSALSYDIGGGYLATSRVANDYDTLSFTPRLNLLHRLFGLDAESVLGVDLYRTDFDSKRDYFGVTRLNMRQDSQALYAQTSLHVGAGTVVTAGARRQRVDQSLDRTASSDLDNDQARTAWDLGISQQLTPSARLFARHGRVFRFARSDELTTYTGLGIPLRPEHGRSSDVGIDWHGGRGRLQATLYRQDLADEIAYNANPDGDWSTYDGRNENLQRTRHQGLTVDASLKLAADLLARAGYSYTKAYFTAGADSGKTIPLVPRQEARLGLNWRISPEWQADGRLNWSSSRYYGSDTDNSAARLAGFLTVDLAATWQRGAWQVRLDGRNLTDKHYATTGFEYLASQYPADGRAFYLSLAYEGDL